MSREASDRNKTQEGCGPSTLPYTEGALYNLSISVSSHIHPITRDWYTATGLQHLSRRSSRRASHAKPKITVLSAWLATCMQDAWTHNLPPCEKPPGQSWHLVSTATLVQIQAFMRDTASYHQLWPAVDKGLAATPRSSCVTLVRPLIRYPTEDLSRRSQNVIVDGCMSSKTAVTSGVPQGTVLGPLFF